MLPQLSQQLLAKWSELPIDRGRPHRLSYLGLRTGVDEGYAFFLGFAGDDAAPTLAVKIPRTPGVESRLQHEWQVLNHLQSREPLRSGASLPRPILWAAIAGRCVLVTSAPPGRPMATDRGSPAEHFALVGDWLVQLASATRSAQPVAPLRANRERTVARLGVTFGLQDREMAVVEDWLAQWLPAVGEGRADLFTAHGNLRRRNIYLNRGHLAVANWDRSELTGAPLHDLFTFATTYRLPPTRRSPLDSFLHAFRATYLNDGPYVDLVCRTIAGYCRALDIPPDSVEAHFGLFLANAALREYEQLLAAAGRGYLPLLRDPARATRRPHQEAIKDQVWINLLRLLVQERAKFRLGVQAGLRGRFRPVSLRKAASAKRPQAAV